MVQSLKKALFSQGGVYKLLPIGYLNDLKKEIEQFKSESCLNNFQKWIVNDLYTFELPKVRFDIKSVLVIAIPHPAYALVEFNKQGRRYYFQSPIMSDFDKTERTLNTFLSQSNYHAEPAFKLPLKRLAVKAGLSEYGKNNITYVKGMGSFFSYMACYTDIPAQTDDFRPVSYSDRCNGCTICINRCPTKAIRKDRFLIDNDKCLSFHNESSDEFPYWIPDTAHHSVYDCLKCQIVCPLNNAYLKNIDETIQFNEKETVLLLEKGALESFPASLKQKLEKLGMDQWMEAIPRNLKVLFEQNDLQYSSGNCSQMNRQLTTLKTI